MKKVSLHAFFRVLGGLVFLALGLSHFYYTTEMAVFVPLPTGSIYFVYGTGLILVIAAFSLLLNQSVRYAWLAIACALALSAGFVQLGMEWRQDDEILRQVGMVNVIKLLMAFVIPLIGMWMLIRKSG